MMLKKTIFNLVAGFLVLSVIISCAKENTEPKPPAPPGFLYRTLVLDYTGKPLKDVVVKAIFADSTYTDTTGVSGFAEFPKVGKDFTEIRYSKTGYIPVSVFLNMGISSPKQDITDWALTTTKMLAEQEPVTITGNAAAELDYTNTTREMVANAKIYFKPLDRDVNFLVTHNGLGNVQNITYIFGTGMAVAGNTGTYTYTFPYSVAGMHMVISADDFEYAVKNADNTVQRKIFKFTPDTMLISNHRIFYKDILFN